MNALKTGYYILLFYGAFLRVKYGFSEEKGFKTEDIFFNYKKNKEVFSFFEVKRDQKKN
jgi:uncharacterized membrane protein YobD (UPF0266 family)